MNAIRVWSVLGLVLLSPCVAYCCSCGELSPEEAFQSADAVFVGEVVRVERILERQDQNDAQGNPIYLQKVLTYFQVKDLWKGIETPMTTLSGIENNTCHYAFAEDQTYLVYANKSAESDTLTTTICQLTKVYSDALMAGEIAVWAPQERVKDADFDNSGLIDFKDFLLFVAAFGGTDSRFDLFPDGQVNFADFVKFAKWFGAPAPN